ncbi:MAG: phage tail protein I [Pseudomonadota bacterium]
MINSLLPTHYTPREHALDAVSEEVRNKLSNDLWDAPILDPIRCNEKFLPMLAKFYGAELWMSNMTTDQQRKAIGDSIVIRKKRGTAWSVKQVIKSFDEGASVIEGVSPIRYDGTHHYDGTQQHGVNDEWAEYSVMLTQPIPSADDQIRFMNMLGSYAPARCHLVGIDWRLSAGSQCDVESSAIFAIDPYSLLSISASSPCAHKASAVFEWDCESELSISASLASSVSMGAMTHLNI